MAKTAVSDILTAAPQEFGEYVIERTAELDNFGASGVAQMDPIFDALVQEAGQKQVNLPTWQDISPTRQLLSDSATLAVNKITSYLDVARIHNDAQVWSVNHLATVISGDDPLGAIVQLVGAYWARIDEGLIVSTLKGAIAAASMSTNLLAIHSESVAGQSASTRLNGSTFVDACVKLGDRQDQLVAVGMHSSVEAALRKLDLIDFIPDSEGKAQLRVFQGRRVIMDDNLPSRAGSTDGTVYTTFLFGMGCIAKGVDRLDQQPLQGGFGTAGVELARVPLDSDTVLINRRRFILHPRGVKWGGTPAGDSPTNTELETGASWTRVYEAKNVRFVGVTHNI